MRYTRVKLSTALCFLGIWPVVSTAQQPDGGVVTPLAGSVEYQMADMETFQGLDEARRLPAGSRVRTGPQGWASMQYENGPG